MILRLLRNGLRYQALRVSGRAVKPQALSLEITHKCIAKCLMCNIWKIPESVQDLHMEDWLNVLSSGFFTDLVELDITGGEPFLRDDLVELISTIRDIKEAKFPGLRSVAITTNGLLTDRVARNTREILKGLEGSGISLVVVIAMDAIGEVHDRIRGVNRAWEKADRTIGLLKRLQQEFPDLILGLKTTILPLNVDQLDAISQYAESKGFFTIISPCIITEGRYLNPEKAASMQFDDDHVRTMINFFKQESQGWGYHSRSLVRYFKTGMMKKPCSCGFNYLFIRSDGSVFPCPLINAPLGNVRERPLAELYLSNEARRFRRRVGRDPQCGSCTEPGLERYSLPFEGFTYLSMMLKMGKTNFLKMHQHLGLDKYM
jgi:MoaA/NifB/PqqE/SkfB family radical SAM enzyme